jgi:hypothetical protein
MLRLFAPGVGAEIMGAGKFGYPGWHEDPEWQGWWGSNPPSTRRSSSSPITRVRRSGAVWGQVFDAVTTKGGR